VTEVYLIRELPDGGKEFVLDDPVLAWIQIDARIHLRFGAVEVVLGGPFDVDLDGIVHRLDPQRVEGLGPLLALFPGTARWLWAAPDGYLQLVFEHGARLRVAPGGPAGAWALEAGGREQVSPGSHRRPGRSGQ